MALRICILNVKDTRWAKPWIFTSSRPRGGSPILGSSCSSVVGRQTSSSQRLHQDPSGTRSAPGPHSPIQCGRQEWSRSSGLPSVPGLLQETGRAFAELPLQSQIPPLDDICEYQKFGSSSVFGFVLLTVIDFPRRAAVAPVTAITPSPLPVIFGPTC